MRYNDGYDGYYEAESNAASDQAMYEQQQDDYLSDLINEGNYLLYAFEVSIYWLNSDEFAKSNLSAIDFLSSKREKFKTKQGNIEPF